MKNRETLDKILSIIHSVMENEEKLVQILDFLENEIYEEEDFEVIEVPEKFKPLITEIAEMIDMGYICFVKTETLDLDFIPRDMAYEVDLFEDEPEEVRKRLLELYDWEEIKVLDWDNYFEFGPTNSNEGFRIMEAFTQRLKNDEKLQNKLINALNRRKPFANFKNIIDNSDKRQDWFDFKQKWLENKVAQELLEKLELLDN